ncbi:prepilin-type N-terminal cleavage/methylation domain-containing protein, partial [Candidatus Microgenomates bacterium]|nr:prepilin-type N-terminal cleavage/methylation domain-containing protein [Candidatus Microgenomates bacterium]
MQNSKLQSGFTLIEMLAVIFVLSTIGVLVAAIITSSLRGTSKTNTITSVRQNGFFAIAQMTKVIQNARRLDVSYSCVPPPTPTPFQSSHQSIVLTSPDGGQTT